MIPTTARNPTDKINILMVDDNPAKLLAYESMLAGLGENLIAATSGREALQSLLRHEVAVILMDVNMPDMDGFQIAEMVRQHPRFQHIAIIFISAIHLTDLDRLKGYQHGAVDYISVPVVPEMLRAKVAVFVDLHRKTRQLESLNRDLELRVRERTEKLREGVELMDLASEAIMVRDRLGVVRYWNSGAERLYGWKRYEIIGRHMHHTLQTRFPVPFAEIHDIIAGTGRWEGNLIQRTKNGTEITVACRKALKSEENGSGTILEINRDITGELQMQEALRKTEKLATMGRVAGMIAHEINNPLAAVTNAVFLLYNHPSLDDKAREYARIANEEVRRVAHITRQTLSFYREPQHTIPVDIAEILEGVLALHRPSLTKNGITVQVKMRIRHSIPGLPGELSQVFSNLINNSIQAMPRGGRLRVNAHESMEHQGQRKGVRISICDTGTGIRREDGEKIFEPFFTTKSMKGTGLGLWISRGVIQKYEGTIGFRTLRRGCGTATCFSVFLPGPQTPANMLPFDSSDSPDQLPLWAAS